LTTPVILQINDATGNETLKLASIASAVNEVTIENAATGNAVHIRATGGDASIGLHLAGKGSSGYVNVQDSVDATKRILFNASGGTTSTRTMLSSTQTIDRTITLPDAAGTVVLNTSGNLATPGAIGGTTASTGAFTTLTSSNTTDSTTTATGAIQTLGGLGVAKSIFTGGNINIPATTSTVGQITQAGVTLLHSFKNASSTGAEANIWIGGAGNLTLTGSSGSTNGLGNVGIGSLSSTAITTGFRNLSIGTGAGGNCTTGTNNVSVGYTALQYNSTGGNNVAIGSSAGRGAGAGSTSLTDTVSIGFDALKGTTGACQYTVAVGYAAGDANTTGAQNTFIGVAAGRPTTTGGNNTCIGALAFTSAAGASYQTVIGADAVGTANNQVMLGRAADTVAVPGIINIAATTSTVGQIKQAGSRILHSYGTQNLFLGDGAGNFTLTGAANVGIGRATFGALTNGARNMAFGDGTMFQITSGADNCAIGSAALNAIISGSSNVGLGSSALLSTTAGGNTGLGYLAGQYNTTGTNNVFIGYNSGGATGSVNLSRCVTLGTTAAITANSLSYCTVIGSDATSATSNSVTLGRSTDTVIMPGGLVTVPVAQTASTAEVSVAVTTTALTTTAPAQAITLANGTNGQIKIITHIASSGSGTAVLTPATSAADYNTITFSSVGDTATLQYHTTGGWYILSLRGAVAA
jgi:hypothetical protein